MGNNDNRVNWERATRGRGTPRRAEDFLEGRVNWYWVFQWKKKAPVKEERSETVGSSRIRPGRLIDFDLFDLEVPFPTSLLLYVYVVIWFVCFVAIHGLVKSNLYSAVVVLVFILGLWLGLYCLCCWAYSRSR